jgi:hypothetical protein
MAVALLSPGVLIREVDLTVGRAENVLDNIGGICGPFQKGPVDDPYTVETEQELIEEFGKPIGTDAQYEYWMSASSFLTYGGVLKVVRTDGATLNNANAGVDTRFDASLKIKNYDDYKENYQTDTGWNYAAKTPGKWANGVKLCFIDDLADQTVGVTTSSLAGLGITVGYGVTVGLTNLVVPNATTGTISTITTGFLKGIVVGVTTDADGSESKFDVKWTHRVNASGAGSTETRVSYAKNDPAASISIGSTFQDDVSITFKSSDGTITGSAISATTAVDWYDQQQLPIDNGTVFWKAIAPRPVANNYVTERQGYNDGMNICIVDDDGVLTGIQGNIVEKFNSLSKALDSVSSVNAPQKIWYKDFLADFSEYAYAGFNPSNDEDSFHGTVPRATGFSTGFVPYTTAEGLWGQNAQGITYAALGNVGYAFSGGVDYSSTGGMKATLGDLITSYNLFKNKEEVAVDYLIMGPSINGIEESQAKANRLISIAEARQDCVAVVSPHRSGVVGVIDDDTQASNIVKFANGVKSSSYGIIDSGYKYTYDRFNNQFRYIPTNADVAGLMTRTNIRAFPWFSPAGQQRGVLNNAVKLAFNPNQNQRDELYQARVNPISFQPGIGILLFGDKTALGYASAFDRINVRRLFLTVEQALEGAAKAQLFELNDEITRANFVNIVEPYLRDVQAKRGIYDFLVICDETNNTPDIIDNNEFRADIFLKPAKSINYVSLTFVATRTGVSFEEVAGRV